MSVMTEMTIEQAGRVFTDPAAYADEPRFHEACALLRREAPVHRVEVDGFNPFYAVTRHADVMEIERQHDKWLNAPRPLLGAKEADDQRAITGDVLRTLIHMDAPDHPVYRHLAADWFLPKSLSRLDDRIAELAKRYVDRMADLGGECDFVRDVAVHYPLYVILSILGLPEDDFPRLLKLTQELFGAADPEIGARHDARRAHADDPGLLPVLRRADRGPARPPHGRPRVGHRERGGQRRADRHLRGRQLLRDRGDRRTRHDLVVHLRRLARPPRASRTSCNDCATTRRWSPTAVDEMIRWVSPVKQFMRTSTEDYVLHGVPIAAGESVLLSYPSANRDEDVFEHADQFDVGRNPNKHMAFGFGAHFCLGAQLARMEGRALYAELMPRLTSIELAGDPAYMQTLFVGGPKRLPIRYELT